MLSQMGLMRREAGKVKDLWYLSAYGQGVVGMSFCSNFHEIANFFEATTAAIILVINAERTGYGLGTCYSRPPQFMDIRLPNSLAYTDVHL